VIRVATTLVLSDIQSGDQSVTSSGAMGPGL
jgi:hypothetical protein